MARAKKTDRSEARRRARALSTDPALATGEPGRGGMTASGALSAGTEAPRLGFFGAFRAAYRPVTLRSDIAQIPWLITRTPAVWLPCAIMLGMTVWFLASGSDPGNLSGRLWIVAVNPPPFIFAFLAGILAPRMTYLAGGFVGLANVLVTAMYAFTVNPPNTTLTSDTRATYVLYALAISPISGLAVGGAAGWYRRFLRLSNPNRNARQAQRGKNAKASPRR